MTAFLLLENLLFEPLWTLEEGQVCLTGVWHCLCHRTEDKEVQELSLRRVVVPEADAAGVGAVVLHGHGSDGDADVPTVHVATEDEALLVALPVLCEVIKVPRHDVSLWTGRGQDQSCHVTL